jgi:hypothetical protein
MTISETTTKNFEALTIWTKTAKEMALTAHILSKCGDYARTPTHLFRWSDSRNAWVCIGKNHFRAGRN